MKLLPWTLPELGRLLWRFVCSPSQSLFIVWHWSLWRRQKQERARQCHYRRHARRTQPSEQLPRQSSETEQASKHNVKPPNSFERIVKPALSLSPNCLPTRVELKRKTYPTVLSEKQWEAAQQVIPVERLVGRPRTTDLRQVLNALCYMQATQCSWRTLPDYFPRWQTVCTYLYRWQRLGVWETICEAISCAEV